MDAARGPCARRDVGEDGSDGAQVLSTQQMYNSSMERACREQKECVKSSVEWKWNLAEAQQIFSGLMLHNSESMDQEQAVAQMGAPRLKQGEKEWRQKEEELIQEEGNRLGNVDESSQCGFNKSFINQGKELQVNEDDASTPFVQKYESKIRHFGMLNRWSDSQRFLSDFPDLVCEETAKYLLLWCFLLEAQQKRALMEQVAHQAVVMQFILEMAKHSNVDPRGCFRLFFLKAQAGEFGYTEAFKSELDAFKEKVKLFSHLPQPDCGPFQHPGFSSSLGPDEICGSQIKNKDSNLHSHLNMEPCTCSGASCCGDEDAKMMDTT